MIKTESAESNKNVCNFCYLIDIVNGKKHLIKGIMDAFLKQVPEDINCINNAVIKLDYAIIKSFAHTMKSSVSIMGISSLVPILLEIENLGEKATGIEKIKKLNIKLNSICKHAVEEIEKEKQNYI